jgi:hypothetical protein
MATTIKRFLFITLPIMLSAFCVSAQNSISLEKPMASKNIFVKNIGQVTDQYGTPRTDLDFKIAAASGLSVFLGNGQLVYQWSKTNESTEMYHMDVKLIGANPNARMTTENQSGFTERYYLTAADHGVLAHTYEKVTYENIYPNIDWVLYFHNGKMEHDFIIHEGGKLSDIKIQYKGADNLHLNQDGSLHAITRLGEITEHAPIAYEVTGNQKISASFVLDGDILSFTTGKYQGSLVIDPVVDWGTYFGGTEYDDISDVILAKDGFTYITGSTNSNSNIATTGAYQTSFTGGSNAAGSDAFLSKFNSNGNLIWSTYYGGTGNDLGKKITADTSGNIYMAGYTNSASGISTTGSYQTTYGGGAYDAFVVKFDTSGQRLWGTYFGGSNADASTSMDIIGDAMGNICLTGNTQSNNIPTTTGAHQSTIGGSHDAFIAKFNGAGQLQWSTYYGGSGADYPYAVTTDSSGNFFIAGRTQSSNGIATSGTQQTTIGGSQDAFITKFSPNGQMLWGTYYGGTDIDRAYAATTDHSGNIYIAGVTLSTSGIATAGSHQSTFGGGAEDGFIAKFSTTGIREWATYYGGDEAEGLTALTCTNDNDLYFTGYTSSDTGIAIPAGMQPTFGGEQDAFVGKINLTGDAVQWASYIGGVDGDNGNGIDADGNGNLIICGRTVSATSIATFNGYQSSFGGGDADGFLIKIKDCNIPQITGVVLGDASVCAGTTHRYTVASLTSTSYNWILQNGWTGNSQIDTIQVTFNGNSGILKAVAVNDCYHSDTVSLNITVNSLPPVPVITRTGNQIKTTQTFAAYQWYLNGIAITGATGQTCNLTATGIYTVVVFNVAGCSNTSVNFDYTGTGIDNILAQNGISIYPNPVNDFLHIQLRVATKVFVYDISGKLVQSIILPSGAGNIDMQDFVTGLYLIRFSDLNGNMLGSCKVSKQ